MSKNVVNKNLTKLRNQMESDLNQIYRSEIKYQNAFNNLPSIVNKQEMASSLNQ